MAGAWMWRAWATAIESGEGREVHSGDRHQRSLYRNSEMAGTIWFAVTGH
jgi:hypothetical protein